MQSRFVRRIAGMTLWALLIACAPAPQAPAAATPETPAPITPATIAEVTGKQEVDYSCQAAADCEIKNIGNCCGAYPACVNKDSPTFPAQVRAECEKEGRMGVCGFPVIASCDCVENRCTNVTGPGTGSQLQ